jgi:hypothetical protein
VHLDLAGALTLTAEAYQDSRPKPMAFMEAQKRELFRPRTKRELVDLGTKKVEILKQERRISAEKYFPFGFGPSDIFEIEEIGGISDDDENYRDYQEASNGRRDYGRARMPSHYCPFGQ